MKWFRPRYARLAAVGLVVACGACLVLLTTQVTMAGEKDVKQITLTDKDSNTTQKLAQGELLVLHLETQPGTGFSWVLTKSNKEQLTLLSSVLLDNPHQIPGGKAVQVFTFKAAAGGASEVDLDYKRPFDKGKMPAKTFKVSVTVEPKGKQITLTEKENNSKQKLSQGDLLVVHLETQPGTGFSWVLAKSDKEQLTLLSSVVLDNPNQLPGGKAVRVFTFQAANVGASDLELHYKRPFDKDKEPAQTFKVSVTVGD